MSLSFPGFGSNARATEGRTRSIDEPSTESARPVERRAPTTWRTKRAPFALGIAAGIAVGIVGMRQHYQQLEVLAVVNGKMITQAELDRRLENAGAQSMMRQIATQEMQLQFARSEGALPSEASMDAKMAALRKSPNFVQMLANSGQTEEDYREKLQIHIAQAALLSRGLTITDEDVHRFYQANVDPRNASAQFYQPATAQTAVIVTADVNAANAADAALKVGTPFSEVAARYSVDSSRISGGTIPTIQRGRTNSSRIPGLEDYIFSLRVGQTSDIRKFGNTYWIIHCLDRTPAKTLSFDQVREDCEIGTRMTKGMAANGAQVQAKFESFQRTSKIQAFSPQYQVAINGR